MGRYAETTITAFGNLLLHHYPAPGCAREHFLLIIFTVYTQNRLNRVYLCLRHVSLIRYEGMHQPATNSCKSPARAKWRHYGLVVLERPSGFFDMSQGRLPCCRILQDTVGQCMTGNKDADIPDQSKDPRRAAFVCEGVRY